MLIDNIKNKCAERGVCVTAMERDLQFGNGTVLYWKDHEPGAYKLKKVADYLGVTLDFLLAE